MKALTCLAFLLTCLPLFAQLADGDRRALAQAELRMSALTETMHTDSSADERFAATRALIRTLVEALDRPRSYDYRFEDLPGVSVRYAPDDRFRVFSWELNVDRDTYRHYGAIQLNSDSLQLYPLIDRGGDWIDNPENHISGADDWMGYVVYGVMHDPAWTYRGRPYYFILGYDSFGAYRRQKVLDVLTFDDGGKPTFGLPIFDTYTESGLLLPDRARLTQLYGAEANVVLRYDDRLGGVVYENLVMVPGSHGEGPVSIPDGSYRLLKLEDGRWREQEKVFDHRYDEAPRESRVDTTRDLFGKKN